MGNMLASGRRKKSAGGCLPIALGAFAVMIVCGSLGGSSEPAPRPTAAPQRGTAESYGLTFDMNHRTLYEDGCFDNGDCLYGWGADGNEIQFTRIEIGCHNDAGEYYSQAQHDNPDSEQLFTYVQAIMNHCPAEHSNLNIQMHYTE